MGFVAIRKVKADELYSLLIFSRKTFFDAFYHLNKPGDMQAYADQHLTRAKLTQEFNNPSSRFYFAFIGQEIVGYIKLNVAPAQSDINDDTSLEIERIYVSQYHQGKQIGKRLLTLAQRIAEKNKLKYIWLGVWDKNHGAIKFYRQNGFELFGSHDFMLGSDLQCDILMRKSVI